MRSYMFVNHNLTVKVIKASIEGVAVAAHTKRARTTHQPYYSHQTLSFISKLIPLALVLVAAFGYSKYQRLNETSVLTNEDIENMQRESAATTIKSITTQTLNCESATNHCSQMPTCAEATYYIRNCPSTEMDGDDDGVRCEPQWSD
jgi:hypothetical protein